AYEIAIAINPRFTDAYFNLAITYNRLGRYQEAIESFKQVIRLSPGMAEAYYGLGVVYLKLEKTDEALVAFKKTVQLNPNHINGHFNLGIIYFNLGDSLSAWNQYEVLKNLDKPMAAELYNIFNFKK
ncbi:MAG: tetratricopeptide repeat protein, partial [candidate division WOR-3 bacterium]